MSSLAARRSFGIMALAPAPGVIPASVIPSNVIPSGGVKSGVTQNPAFPAALMPRLGDITLLRLQLFGQYALGDGKSRPCRTLQIDPNQIALSCEVNGQPGDRIDLDLDLLGVLHGVIDARMAAGLRINVGDAYQEHIAEKLAWFKASLSQGTGDTDNAPFRERRAQRIVPRQTQCRFVDPDGVLHEAEILNVSCSGAAIKSTYLPLVGAPIVLGGAYGRRGLTVRRLDAGFAIAFLEPIPAHHFGPYLVF